MQFGRSPRPSRAGRILRRRIRAMPQQRVELPWAGLFRVQESLRWISRPRGRSSRSTPAEERNLDRGRVLYAQTLWRTRKLPLGRGSKASIRPYDCRKRVKFRRAPRLRLGLVNFPTDCQREAVLIMRRGVVRIDLDCSAEFGFRFGPVEIVLNFDRCQRAMRLGESAIQLQCLFGRRLGFRHYFEWRESTNPHPKRKRQRFRYRLVRNWDPLSAPPRIDPTPFGLLLHQAHSKDIGP